MHSPSDLFTPAEILLPAPGINPETWACIACDQYTSEPEYWEKASDRAGENPSALRLILPECYLQSAEIRVPQIHATMRDYLSRQILVHAADGFVLCERSLSGGVRRGLIGKVDLEEYSYHTEDFSPVRPTEQTISARIPPRLVIRRGAPVELTHIMLLINDPERSFLEPLATEKNRMRKLYDFDLMLGGGHLTGYAVENSRHLAHVRHSLEDLYNREASQAGIQPMVLAVGDGNHSLATAKAYWEEIKTSLSESERLSHPARYALCEIVNLFDPALKFEPIHRLLKDTDLNTLIKEWLSWTAEGSMQLAPARVPGSHAFTLLSPDREETVSVIHPREPIPCATLQTFLDDCFLPRHPEAEIDFIHGEESLRLLASKPKNVGILLPEIRKDSFFQDIRRLGVLPRKTFSMGEAFEKRYYMEARMIGG